VNAAIYSPSGSNAGIRFAIPVDAVSRVVPKLIRNGRVPTPSIGIVGAGRAPRDRGRGGGTHGAWLAGRSHMANRFPDQRQPRAIAVARAGAALHGSLVLPGN